MLCYVLNPPTHLAHYELLPEAFFRPFFLFTLHCTQLTLGLKNKSFTTVQLKLTILAHLFHQILIHLVFVPGHPESY